MNAEHPKAVEAEQRATDRREKRKAMKRVLEEARNRDCHFLTVGAYTICYSIDKRDVLHISTTLRHPKDRFDKLIGQYEAFRARARGRAIMLKKPSSIDAKTFLRTAFNIFTMPPNVFKTNTLAAGLMK